MCIIAAKYFANVGWVGVKNRDRNYIPDISFPRHYRQGVEEFLFWDDITKYCEGTNNNGVSILSASLMVLDDEKEITTRRKRPSPDGQKIKRALTEPTVELAAKNLIKHKLTGNTIIFDRNTCYLLEGAWKNGGYKNKDYIYKIKKIVKSQPITRTNHGIWLPHAGYQRNSDNKAETLSRISSESRRKIAQYVVDKAKTPQEIIDGLAKSYIDEPQLNCLRTTHGKKQMRTTSQILIVPKDKTLFVRPVQSQLSIDFHDINDPKHQTWVELLSNRILYDKNSRLK